MKTHQPWARILKIVGGIAMLLGTLDPLEGSLLILPGSGLVALGMFLSGENRSTMGYWLWAFGLIALGVGVLFGLSALGGVGGTSAYSIWWALLILPYPVGWIMALAGSISAISRYSKSRKQPIQCPQ